MPSLPRPSSAPPRNRAPLEIRPSTRPVPTNVPTASTEARSGKGGWFEAVVPVRDEAGASGASTRPQSPHKLPLSHFFDQLEDIAPRRGAQRAHPRPTTPSTTTAKTRPASAPYKRGKEADELSVSGGAPPQRTVAGRRPLSAPMKRDFLRPMEEEEVKGEEGMTEEVEQGVHGATPGYVTVRCHPAGTLMCVCVCVCV